MKIDFINDKFSVKNCQKNDAKIDAKSGGYK
jgi:hypothetical protein